MKIKMYFGYGLAVRNDIYKVLKRHPLFVMVLENEKFTKAFILNLTTANIAKKNLHILNDGINPIIFTSKFSKNKHDMYLIADLAVLNLTEVSFPDNKTDFCRVFLEKEYKCDNLNELKDEIVKNILKFQEQIITYNGKTGKLISESIDEDLLAELKKNVIN